MSLSQFQKNLNLSRYEEAKKFASHYHKNDKYGDKPYFDFHLMGVANLVKRSGYGLVYQIVAILHDVREDHKIPLDMLISKFGYDIGMAVDAMSYRKGEETKAEYWERCSQNAIASVVKSFDAKFNKEQSFYELNDKRGKYYAKIESIMNKAMERHTMKEFFESLEEFGGLYDYSDLTNAKSMIYTIILGLDDLIYSPKFMWDKNESGELEVKPMFAYVVKELRERTKLSNVRLTNFFTKKEEWPGVEEKINLIDLFKTEMTLDQQMYLDMKIQNAGTNNLL